MVRNTTLMWFLYWFSWWGEGELICLSLLLPLFLPSLFLPFADIYDVLFVIEISYASLVVECTLSLGTFHKSLETWHEKWCAPIYLYLRVRIPSIVLGFVHRGRQKVPTLEKGIIRTIRSALLLDVVNRNRESFDSAITTAEVFVLWFCDSVHQSNKRFMAWCRHCCILVIFFPKPPLFGLFMGSVYMKNDLDLMHSGLW